ASQEIIDAAKKNNTAYRINRFQEQALDMKTKELQLEEKIVHDLYPDWKRGFISESQFKRLNQESQEKITRLKEEIAELSKESFSEDRNAKQSVLIDELIKYRNIKTLTRDIVIALIDRIMIHDNKIIDIQFTFKNTLSEMKTEITQNIQ
ncbi:MAG: hypothetical protein J6K75_05280, partial [Erysipelotrichaceae bacterium]|nr:hypothetical protein [Erysipelotrichaceae bacterium]